MTLRLDWGVRMFTRTRIAAASAGAGLLLAGYVGGSTLGQPLAFGQSAANAPSVSQVVPAPSPGPHNPNRQKDPSRAGHRKRGGGDPQQRQQMREQFRNTLAQKLGVSPERLTQAFRETRIDMINAAVRAGRLTQEQADRIIQRINSGQQPGPRGPRPSASPTP